MGSKGERRFVPIQTLLCAPERWGRRRGCFAASPAAVRFCYVVRNGAGPFLPTTNRRTHDVSARMTRFLVCALFVWSLASAQQGSRTEHAVQRIDRNGDRTVTRDEARDATWFDRLDRDGNGAITLDTKTYDLPKLMQSRVSGFYNRVFGNNPEVWRDASPITHVAADTHIPPFLICYSRGMRATLNPARPEQANAFAEALRAAGIRAEVIDASDRSHREINAWFGQADDEKVTAAAARFVDSILGVKSLARKKPPTPALRPGDHIRQVTMGTRLRRYAAHIPAGYDSDRRWPVVLAFHGGGGNPRSMMRLSGLSTKADEAGFIVVYPYGSGEKPERFLTFNGGNCCAYAMRHNVDDVAFTRALLDDLARVANVDVNRVFATGISNGAIMTYRLASELSDRIAAIAPVGGPMGTESCTPERPVSVMHFHGTADRFAPFEGGYGKRAGGGSGPTDFHSVEHSVYSWVKANGCDPEPKIVDMPDKADDGTRVTRKTWSGGRDGSEVVLIEIEGGGHTWPGREPTVAFLGTSTKDISANDLMWEFFRQHPRSDNAAVVNPTEGSTRTSGTAPEPGTRKPLGNGDASEDASGTGQLFESKPNPGLLKGRTHEQPQSHSPAPPQEERHRRCDSRIGPDPKRRGPGC